MYKFKLRAENRLLIIKIILIIAAWMLSCFFIIRFVPLTQKDEGVDYLRLVSEENPVADSYRPKLMAVENVEVSEECAEDLGLMLAAAREAGCEPLLLEGYADRKSQQQRYDEHINKLVAEGSSLEEAEILALKTMSKPGADEHQLGLTVDICDADFPERDMEFLNSKTYKWLSEHAWEYGFVIRYPEEKIHITGRDYMPWHYRYVGAEAAQLMLELDMCLEEYYTWFYSDDVIVIN